MAARAHVGTALRKLLAAIRDDDLTRAQDLVSRVHLLGRNAEVPPVPAVPTGAVSGR
ncbi:MAG: hypothetical protein KJ548_09485 [Actinobacteria bacterium]|nr:hypothetical protein [Actinomycetota bacterium]